MGAEKSSYINLAAARDAEQEKQYRQIAEAGVCPFCPEHYGKFMHQDTSIFESEHWYAITNMSPYPYTKLHNVIIAKRHIDLPNDLTDIEWLDLKKNVDHFIRMENLEYGALAMRFGDPIETGASVRHLHVHLIVPDESQTSEQAEVKFRMSRKY
jgi:diadenosine tetraphosphate (Ap4A) HIT family hydrolase